MNELIKIEVKDGKQLVSARELHEKLITSEGKKERFSQWFNRHLQYGFGFIENTDYVECKKIYTANQHGATGELQDYAVTLDMAKELSMLQRNDIGRKFRQYFIECEKQVKRQVVQLSDYDKAILEVMRAQQDIERVSALRHFQEVIQKPLLEEIEIQRPKVTVYDKFMETKFTFTSTQVAKLIGVSSAMKLNDMLKESKIIYKQGKTWHPHCTTHKSWYQIKVNEYGTQIRFTSKGIVELAKMYDLKLNEKELNNTLSQ